jgi:hypothetical protein
VSEPKRYQPVVQCVEPSYQAQMIEPKVMEFSEGEYVLHSDYARLKAEVERLTKQNALATPRSLIASQDIKTLRAEVERLTNAGDCLVIHLEACYRAEGYDPKDCDMIDNWNAAKKGAAS